MLRDRAIQAMNVISGTNCASTVCHAPSLSADAVAQSGSTKLMIVHLIDSQSNPSARTAVTAFIFARVCMYSLQQSCFVSI
jgi:hypothetical protein